MAGRFYEELDAAVPNHHIIDDDEEDEAEEDYYEDEHVDMFEKFDGKLDDLACPFCFEDFDVLGLCCHIDSDHRMEVKPGICPVCAEKVRINMASHVITQHDSVLKISFITFVPVVMFISDLYPILFFHITYIFSSCYVYLNSAYVLGNTQHHSSRSRSRVFLFRKEMHEKHLRRIKESSKVEISSDPASDSTLLSFVNNPQRAERALSDEPSLSSSSEATLPAEIFNENSSERTQPSISADRNMEKVRRCEFLQGLVLSTIFDDL